MGDAVHPPAHTSVAEFSPALYCFDIHTILRMFIHIESKAGLFQQGICRFSFFNFIASLFQVSLSLWIHHANIGVLLRYLGIVLGSLHCNSYLFANTRFTTSACYNCSQCNMDIRRTSCHLSIIGNDQGLIRQPDDRSTKCAAVGQLKVCCHSRDITQVQRLSCIHSEVLL